MNYDVLKPGQMQLCLGTGVNNVNRTVQIAFMVLSVAIILAGRPANGVAAELIMFEQDYCEWCDQWNEDIGVVYFKTPEGKRAPLRRVNIHSDIPQDIRHIRVERFTPTFVLIDEGKEFGRIRGYPGEDFFWGLLGQLMKKLPDAASK